MPRLKYLKPNATPASPLVGPGGDGHWQHDAAGPTRYTPPPGAKPSPPARGDTGDPDDETSTLRKDDNR